MRNIVATLQTVFAGVLVLCLWTLGSAVPIVAAPVFTAWLFDWPFQL